MRISAKEAVYMYKLDKQPLINLVRRGDVIIYDDLGDVVTLTKHQSNFSECVYDYTPIDFSELTNVFDFGDTVDTAKADHIKKEEIRRRKALRDIEYELIITNYFFEKSDLDNTSNNTGKQSNSKIRVEVPSELINGLPNKDEFKRANHRKNRNEKVITQAKVQVEEMLTKNIPKCVIAYVLVVKKGYGKTYSGYLLYSLINKAPDEKYASNTINELISEADNYTIEYI